MLDHFLKFVVFLNNYSKNEAMKRPVVYRAIFEKVTGVNKLVLGKLSPESIENPPKPWKIILVKEVSQYFDTCKSPPTPGQLFILMKKYIKKTEVKNRASRGRVKSSTFLVKNFQWCRNQSSPDYCQVSNLTNLLTFCCRSTRNRATKMPHTTTAAIKRPANTTRRRSSPESIRLITCVSLTNLLSRPKSSILMVLTIPLILVIPQLQPNTPPGDRNGQKRIVALGLATGKQAKMTQNQNTERRRTDVVGSRVPRTPQTRTD